MSQQEQAANEFARICRAHGYRSTFGTPATILALRFCIEAFRDDDFGLLCKQMIQGIDAEHDLASTELSADARADLSDAMLSAGEEIAGYAETIAERLVTDAGRYAEAAA